MMTKPINPIADSSAAFLSWVHLTMRLRDIRHSLDSLTKRNRSADDCLTLQAIRNNLTEADEATEDMGKWIGEVDQFTEANPTIRQMTPLPE